MAVMSKNVITQILQSLYNFISTLALLATALYPKNPSPRRSTNKLKLAENLAMEQQQQ